MKCNLKGLKSIRLTQWIVPGLFVTIVATQSPLDSLIKSGWDLVWHDEFNTSEINYNDWEHDMGTGAPTYQAYGESSAEFAPPGFPNDQYSIRWEGYIIPEFSSEYTMYTIADDGVRLWINDQLIIDKWIPQAPTEWSGKINLTAEEKYSLKIEYFEDSGGETFILGWSCDQLEKQLVPSNRLMTPKGESGLIGYYFANKSLDKTIGSLYEVRTDSVLNWVTGSGWGNNEHQYYTNNPKNIRIENGKLIIEAHQERYEGLNYTSSRIKTKNSWKYGRFEIKAKLPHGRGTWAAIWGLSTDWEYGGWPESGEIDIVEHVGFSEGDIVASVHNKNLAGNLYQSKQQASLEVPDACSQFHIYVLEWDADVIRVTVDEKLIFDYPNIKQGWQTWPFDKRFHMLMNIAIGGNWGGMQGIDESIFPTKMEVEYFRVYQK